MSNFIFVTPHAQERIRQRFGIESVRAMQTWAKAKLIDGKLDRKQPDGRLVYRWGSVELVVSSDGSTLITVMDVQAQSNYIELLGEAVVKKARTLLVTKERAFRKAEINVAEITLNMLKARNPKIKALLSERLTKANDIKENLATEIKLIRKAAEQYGVNV